MNVPKDKVESGYGRRCWVTAKFYGKTEEEVNEKAKRYFAEWPYRGYDTRFTSPPRLCKDGYWSTTIERYSTCD